MCDATRENNDILDYKTLNTMIRVEFIRLL